MYTTHQNTDWDLTGKYTLSLSGWYYLYLPETIQFAWFGDGRQSHTTVVKNFEPVTLLASATASNQNKQANV